jgi:hypothetical protein
VRLDEVVRECGTVMDMKKESTNDPLLYDNHYGRSIAIRRARENTFYKKVTGRTTDGETP